MTHLHITSWVLAIILALYVGHGYKNGQNVKVAHMILRLLYFVILGTGLYLFIDIPGKENMPSDMKMLYNVKMTLGIIMLGIFEYFTVSSKKKRKMLVPATIFTLLILALVYIGFRLPQGFTFFA
jgi:CDP-diglyceride synthetase